MDIKEMVEKLEKYGIKTNEKELMEKERKRLMKRLMDDLESGWLSNINTTLKELERLNEKEWENE